MSVETLAGCTYEQAVRGGDRRAPLIKQQHPAADAARREREAKARTVRVLMGRFLQDVIEKATAAIGRVWVRS
jgi:hypothetical protein